MANWSLISNTIKAGSNSASTTTDPISTVGANLIIVSVHFLLSSLPTITDSSSNATWTTSPQYFDTNVTSSSILGMWYIINPITSASHTFTAARAGTNYFAAVSVAAFATAGTSIASDQGSSVDSDTSEVSTINCGAILPTSNNELLYVILGSAGTSSPAPASFILNPGTVLDSTPHVAGTSYGLTHGYYELPSPVSIVETWSWTNNGIALAVVGGFPAFPFTYPPYDMMGTMAF